MATYRKLDPGVEPRSLSVKPSHSQVVPAPLMLSALTKPSELALPLASDHRPAKPALMAIA